MRWVPKRLRVLSWVKIFLYGVGGIVALLAAFYGEENIRGKWSWDKYRRAWEEKGERFDPASFVPPAIPEASNFAMAPIVVSAYSPWLDAKGNPKAAPENGASNGLDFQLFGTRERITTAAPTHAIGNRLPPSGWWPSNGIWQLGKTTDLTTWQSFYRNPSGYCLRNNPIERAVIYPLRRRRRGFNEVASAYQKSEARKWEELKMYQGPIGPEAPPEFPRTPEAQAPGADILLALSRYDGAVEELREASRRPVARFPINYTSLLNAHPRGLGAVGPLLELRACAELSMGDHTKACEDVRLLFRVARAMEQQPDRTARLFEMELVSRTLQPIWEGLAEGKWTEDDLKALGDELAGVNLFSDFAKTARGECAGVLSEMENLRQNRPFEEGEQDCGGWQESVMITVLKQCPDGWYYQNERRLCRAYMEEVAPRLDAKTKTVSRELAAGLAREAKLMNGAPAPDFGIPASLVKPTVYSWLAGNWFQGLAVGPFVYGQATVELARVGCALERYRIKTGTYPETLEKLSPEFMEELPVDVITEKPLHYRRESDGRFTLYATGWDGKDRGGVTETTKFGMLAGDWVWKYP